MRVVDAALPENWSTIVRRADRCSCHRAAVPVTSRDAEIHFGAHVSLEQFRLTTVSVSRPAVKLTV